MGSYSGLDGSLIAQFPMNPTQRPKKTIVKITIDRAVVITMPLLAMSNGSLVVKPNAMAPLKIPANAMKNTSYHLTPEL